jgi:anion-transporting  ArsA/GET3 family ATPase
VLERKLLVISGKGGVGKSAVTAALALRAARLGKKVLAFGLTDELGLAAHLGSDLHGYEPHEVHPGVFTATMDRVQALDEYLRLQLRLPPAAPTRQFSKALNVLIDTAPGVREIISMGKPIFEAWRETFDLVLVDAPPLGQLMSYLRAPATIADLVPSGTVREQAEAIRDTLGDAATSGLVLVTTAEELPVIETREALADIATDSVVDLVALVVNRMLDPLELTTQLDTIPAGPHREAASLHMSLVAEQGQWMSHLSPDVCLPFLFGLLTPGEIAARLADAWEVS